MIDFLHMELERWAGEVAPPMKALVPKPDDPSFIPKTHLVEGENQLPLFSSNLHTRTMAFKYLLQHPINE